MRDLSAMIVVGTGNRQAKAATGRKSPRDRQQWNADALDLARHKQRGVGAAKRAERPGRAIALGRRPLLAMQRSQQPFGDIALGAVGLDSLRNKVSAARCGKAQCS